MLQQPRIDSFSFDEATYIIDRVTGNGIVITGNKVTHAINTYTKEEDKAAMMSSPDCLERAEYVDIPKKGRFLHIPLEAPIAVEELAKKMALFQSQYSGRVDMITEDRNLAHEIFKGMDVKNIVYTDQALVKAVQAYAAILQKCASGEEVTEWTDILKQQKPSGGGLPDF